MTEFLRIGDKLIDPRRLHERIHEILTLRCQGLSQQEVADRVGVDRTFISRLEGMGEIRRGPSIGLVAMPVANKEEILKIASEEGVDYSLVMTNQERWAFAQERSGVQLINDMVRLIGQVRAYDTVILLGSDERVRFIEALLDKDTVSLELGVSPMTEDAYVDPYRFRQLIREIKG